MFSSGWPRPTTATRTRAEKALIGPLNIELDTLRNGLRAELVTLDKLPPEIKRDWLTADGRARVSASPKGDPNDNEVIREFARAVLAVEPSGTGAPVSILELGGVVVYAFLQAGTWALVSIAIILWITLGRWSDVLLTLVPLVLAGVVTLEICVLIGLKLNFANIIALPLLLGVGVAFKIYYIMAWRAGQTNLLQSAADARGVLQRHDHGDRVRQPVVIEPSRHLEHGQADGACRW